MDWAGRGGRLRSGLGLGRIGGRGENVRVTLKDVMQAGPYGIRKRRNGWGRTAAGVHAVQTSTEVIRWEGKRSTEMAGGGTGGKKDLVSIQGGSGAGCTVMPRVGASTPNKETSQKKKKNRPQIRRKA